jgi:hypothetical protein
MIYLIWGTIRPQIFKETYKYWMDRANYPEKIISKVVVKTEEQKAELEGFDVTVVKENGYTYGIYQITKNLELEDTDIILLPTDDTYCPNRWDKYLYKKFTNWDGALYLEDGQNDINRELDNTLAMPLMFMVMACMTFKCLKQLNKCIFSPHYYHFFSDVEALHNLYDLGLIKDDRKIDNKLFHHKHYYEGLRKKDASDESHYGNPWYHDHDMLYERMKLPVEERLRTITNE